MISLILCSLLIAVLFFCFPEFVVALLKFLWYTLLTVICVVAIMVTA